MSGGKGRTIRRTCDVCHSEYDASVRRLERGWDVCCSKACANIKRATSRTAWRESTKGYTRQNSTSRFKEQMRAQAGYRCQGCTKHQDDLSRRLDVHRVIPEDKGGQYVEANVRVLCAACHIAEERWQL